MSKVVRCSFVHPSGKAAERSRQERNGAARRSVARPGVAQRRQRAHYVNAYIYSVFLCRQQGQNANFCRNLHAKDRVASIGL